MRWTGIRAQYPDQWLIIDTWAQGSRWGACKQKAGRGAGFVTPRDRGREPLLVGAAAAALGQT